MKIYLILLLFIFIYSCASGPSGYWQRPEGKTEQQLEEDEFDCEMKASMAAPIPASDRYLFTAGQISANFQRAKYYNRCMEIKGYRWIRKE